MLWIGIAIGMVIGVLGAWVGLSLCLVASDQRAAEEYRAELLRRQEGWWERR